MLKIKILFKSKTEMPRWRGSRPLWAITGGRRCPASLCCCIISVRSVSKPPHTFSRVCIEVKSLSQLRQRLVIVDGKPHRKGITRTIRYETQNKKNPVVPTQTKAGGQTDENSQFSTGSEHTWELRIWFPYMHTRVAGRSCVHAHTERAQTQNSTRASLGGIRRISRETHPKVREGPARSGHRQDPCPHPYPHAPQMLFEYLSK